MRRTRPGAFRAAPGFRMSEQDDDWAGGDEEEIEEDAEEAGDWLIRVLPESELAATGAAASTGIQLCFYGPDTAGMDAWELGEAWGWSPPELEEMRLAGDHLVAVLSDPGERWGRATADALANLARGLLPEHFGEADAELLANTLTLAPHDAEARRVRKLQRRLAVVFGIRDGVFGSGRLPRRGETVDGLQFFIDEKARDGMNPLAPGSALPLEEYPTLPTVVRLPWDREEEE